MSGAICGAGSTVPSLKSRVLTPDEKQAKFEQEINDARSGRHPYVSTNAAAWYLRMHHCTLSKLVSRGLAPPAVVLDSTRGRNARRFYQLDDLDDWLALRTAKTSGERTTLVQLDVLTNEERRLRALSQLSKAKTRARVLLKSEPSDQ